MTIRPAKMTRQNGRRGFTTVVVIATMLFLSGAIVSLGNLFAHEIARTREAKAEIQTRQLLVAAISAARQELASNGTAARDVTVAVPLDGATLTLHIAPAANGSEVTATTVFNTFKSVESLSFSSNFDLTACVLMQSRGK